MEKYLLYVFVFVLISTSPGIAFARPRCVLGDPLLNIWFHASPLDPGQNGYIAMDIGNGDSDVCPDSNFKFSINMPNSWHAFNTPAGPVFIPATGNQQPTNQVQIDFRVPQNAQQRVYPFIVTVKNKRTKRVTRQAVTVQVGGTPVIETMSPASGPAGTHITLTGRNFGTLPTLAFQNNTDGLYYIRDVASNGSTYSFDAPAMISLYTCGCKGTTTPGLYNVMIGNNGTYSNMKDFTFTP